MAEPAPAPRCRRSVNLQMRLARQVERELGPKGNFNDLVQQALWLYFVRGESRARAHEYRELTLLPSSTSSVDGMMEWILARQPLVWDMMDVEGELHGSVVAVVRDILPTKQARRVIWRFRGLTLEEIGRKDQCSKQAVHTSLVRASKVLSESERFAGVLLRVLGREEEEGLTPQLLVAAVRERS